MAVRIGVRCSCLLLGAICLARAQKPAEPKQDPPIQDNSFLIEEAYNQEPGVVQHISLFSRMWNSKDWIYNFTQEWPGRNPRHQFSYTVLGMHAGAFTGAGLGDVALNYRYQVLGNGESRLAFAPRLSLLAPTGDVGSSRGMGGAGVQVNLPLSIVLQRRLVSHWNAGATWVPRAQDADHNHASSAGYNLGQSLVLSTHPRINLMLETTMSRFQSVTGPGQTEWATVMYASPGVRWSYNLASGLQIVPGVAVPVGLAGGRAEKGLLLYLSFEHPFTRSRL